LDFDLTFAFDAFHRHTSKGAGGLQPLSWARPLFFG